MNKIAIFYHYYKVNQTYHDNLIYFISVAWREDYDFYIIDAGSDEELKLPELNNIFKIRVENKNLDYGGYSQTINIIGDKIKNYEYLFFINSSVRGPFLENNRDDWTSIFLNKLRDNVNLVGSSINILSADTTDSVEYKKLNGGSPPFTHVQTTAYAMTQELLSRLIDERFYSFTNRLNKSNLIFMYEIGLSQAVFKSGGNIDCVLPKYSGLDYRKVVQDINPASRFGDPLRRGAYFGKTASPTELIFIKTNRRLISPIKLDWITYAGLRKEFNQKISDWEEHKALIKTTKKKLIQPLYVVLLISLAITTTLSSI